MTAERPGGWRSPVPKSIDLDQVHIFVSVLGPRDAEADRARYAAILEPYEIDKASRFHFERDRRRHLVTRALARTILSRYTSIAPEALRFATNAYGRPEIAAEPPPAQPVSFNISHSADVVVMAVTGGGNIGADVESLSRREGSLSLAERFFAPAEAAELRELPPLARQRRFLEFWTLKESYIKATGIGLSARLDSFSFRLGDPPAIRFEVSPELADAAERWHFWQFEPVPGYLMALCTERAGTRVPKLTFSRVEPFGAEQACFPTLVRYSHQYRNGTGAA